LCSICSYHWFPRCSFVDVVRVCSSGFCSSSSSSAANNYIWSFTTLIASEYFNIFDAIKQLLGFELCKPARSSSRNREPIHSCLCLSFFCVSARSIDLVPAVCGFSFFPASSELDNFLGSCVSCRLYLFHISAECFRIGIAV